jgi:hypothetical protein
MPPAIEVFHGQFHSTINNMMLFKSQIVNACEAVFLAHLSHFGMIILK